MTEERVQRRSAAILAADVVGYSVLMQRAEEAIYAEFERLKRNLIEPSLCRHLGEAREHLVHGMVYFSLSLLP